MKSLSNLIMSLAIAGFLATVTSPLATAAGTENTVYDPKILDRISFSKKQLPAVKAILDRSESAIVKVFAKYKINPNAKPDFDLLRAASTELQAIESWEKKRMKRILSNKQYADYLEIQQATTAAVIKATRDD